MRFAHTVTKDHVRAEAARRIEARYPIHKQLNLPREDAAAAAVMWEFIDRIRAASNRLERMQGIPADYREDKHWQ